MKGSERLRGGRQINLKDLYRPRGAAMEACEMSSGRGGRANRTVDILGSPEARTKPRKPAFERG